MRSIPIGTGALAGSAGNDRLMLPDVLKGVAVLLMIQVHLTEQFARPEVFTGVYGRISLFLGGPPAAPVFMAVMGYFLARSTSAARSMLMRGARLILYGFLLNIGMNLNLFWHILTGKFSLDPLHYLFGVDILFLAGLSVIVIALFRLIAGSSVYMWLILLLLVAATAGFLPASDSGHGGLQYLLAFVYLGTEWSYFPLIPWIVYPLAGYCYFRISQHPRLNTLPQNALILTGITLGIPVMLSIGYAVNHSWNLEYYYHHTVEFVAWILMFLGFWVAAFRLLISVKLFAPVSRFLQWTGKNVTAFYVVQWLIIGNLATELYKTAGVFALIGWFAGITLLSGLLVSLYVSVKQKYRVRTTAGFE